jgi:hypothetical protein
MENPVNLEKVASPRLRKLHMWAAISILFFLVISIWGNVSGPMDNDTCYRLLGCNIGFFGYDAFVHFFSGVMDVIAFLWVISLMPKLYILNDAFWKNVFILVLVAAFVGSLWEVGEFIIDYIKVNFLHINIFAPVNRMYQPTNSDTIGDMSFNMLGAFIAACISRVFHKKRA